MSSGSTGDSKGLLGSILKYVKSIVGVPCQSAKHAKADESIHCHGIGLPRVLTGFHQFDLVSDYSDHHFRDQGRGHIYYQPPSSWAKKIQKEWKILQANLPETIFVRVYESRMDLMRAAIIGPAGTPYQDGLFFFDIFFPTSYPNRPPMVHYRSGGLKPNPNLYKDGTVCLSLLGTWIGKANELWIPNKSSILQVVVSLQALVLNSKPFFNEPGFATLFGGFVGRWMSKSYNEEAFIASLKTIIYTLRNPPRNFECLVMCHFRMRATDIVTACRAYKEGAEVGSDFRKILKEGGKVKDNSSRKFKSSLDSVVKLLIQVLAENGLGSCEKLWTG